MNDLTPLPRFVTSADLGATPTLIAASGPEAETRFWEFLTVTIRSPNARAAYARAAAEFCAFVEAGGITVTGFQPGRLKRPTRP